MNLTNHVNSIAKLSLSVCKSQKYSGLCPQTPATAQSTALHVTSFTNYPASIVLRENSGSASTNTSSSNAKEP